MALHFTFSAQGNMIISVKKKVKIIGLFFLQENKEMFLFDSENKWLE